GPLDPMEVKEHQLVAVVDHHRLIAPIQTDIREIPWRQIGAEVLDNVDVGKQPGEPIEIALVGETVTVDKIVAPFDTARAPPAQRRKALPAATHAHPSDIVNAEAFPVFHSPGEAMRDDAER